jgi:3-oxoacyl-[acyl-carrier-protein] synthase II
MIGHAARPRVVVTGCGMITPLGRTTEETFQNCARGMSGIDTITSFDVRGLPCQVGGAVRDEWLQAHDDILDKRSARLSSRALRMMVIAAREAAAQANLEAIPQRERIGVSLGTFGETPAVEDVVLLHQFYDGHGGWDLEGLRQRGGRACFQFFQRKPDVASAILAMVFNCRGSNLATSSTCAAGAQAIGEALRVIQAGKCDVMIAGGCDAALNFTGFIGFILLKALAERYATPQSASRPFDRKRTGFVMAEGAAALILEEFEHARRREAPILGELLGYGASSDAYRITDTHPQGEGAVMAMRSAMADASLGPEDIDYINAHGTSTVKNDWAESLAIGQVFGSRKKEIPVSSNKSMLGHAIGASGAIELILTLVGMSRSHILPTMNYDFPDPKCDLWTVPNKAIYREHRIALSNSFGFGGQNACLCIGKAGELGFSDRPTGANHP